MNCRNLARALCLSTFLIYGISALANDSVQQINSKECDRYLDPAKFDTVTSRGKKVEEIVKQIKSRTIGIDDSIDRVAAAIRPWFVTQAQDPTIIGLWGPPSGGKTSTISDLIEGLGAKLVYIDASKLAKGDQSTYHYNAVNVDPFLFQFVEEVYFKDLEPFDLSSNIYIPRFVIPPHLAVFIDEMQTVRTIDDKGSEVERPALQVFFSILSRGGRVTVPSIEYRTLKSLITKVHDNSKHSYRKVNDEYITEDEVKKRNAALQAALEARLAQVSPMITLDFRSSLFVIAGNLFSIFPSNKDSSPSEVKVDDRNLTGSLLTESDIIGALRGLFSAQHVSRLGTTHISFPSLSAKYLRELIDTDLRRIITQFRQKERIELEITSPFRDRLFQELLISGAEPRGLFGIYSAFLAQPMTRVIEMIYAKSADAASLTNYKTLKITANATAEENFARWTIIRDDQQLGEIQSPIPSSYANLLKLADSPERERRALRVAARLVVETMTAGQRASEVWVNSLTKDNMGYVEFTDIPNLDVQRLSSTQAEFMKNLAARVGPRVAELMVMGEPTNATTSLLGDATVLVKEMITEHAFQLSPEFFSFALKNMDGPKDRDLLVQADRVMKMGFDLAAEWLTNEKAFFRAVTQRLTEVGILNRRELDSLYNEYWKTDNLDHAELGSSQPAKLTDSDLALRKFLTDPEVTLSLPDKTHSVGFKR